MTRRKQNDGAEEPEERSFLRIIPLVQAEDIAPAPPGEGNNQDPGNQPGNQPEGNQGDNNSGDGR